MTTRAALLFASLALAGCASTSPRAAQDDVAKHLEKSLGQRTRFVSGGAEDREVDARVAKLLANELGPDDAVTVALLRNRHLHALYEELGVAQAELVQAGLLSNPSLGASLKFPVSGGGPALELGLVQSFVELLFLPARKDLAALELEHAKLSITAQLLAHAADVKTAYYELVAAEQVVAMERVIVESSYASAELARRQEGAGTMSGLELTSYQLAYEEARLALARHELAVMRRREELTRLLGLYGAETSFRVSPRLADLPATEPSLERLEAAAIAARPELAAARQHDAALEHALALARTGRWVSGTELGVAAERDHDGAWSVGPEASIELPIFDQGQAGIAQLEAALAAHRAETDALAVEIRSEVRESRDRMRAARQVAEHYRAVVVPLRERVVFFTQQQYDAMLAGVYELIAAKNEEVGAYREYIESVAEYWTARVALERALGGRLPASPAPAPAPPPTAAPAAPPVDHSHH